MIFYVAAILTRTLQSSFTNTVG